MNRKNLPNIDDEDELSGSALAARILESLDEAISSDPDLQYRIKHKEENNYE